jgi:D-xylose transport system substrate-binding protein
MQDWEVNVNQGFKTTVQRSVRLATAAFVCAAIGGSMVSTAQAEDITIAVAMKTQVQRRWAFDAEAMKQQAEKLGVKLVFQWANDDPAAQASQVENLLSQNPKALILVPVNSESAGRLVKSAQQQKVPVVVYDIGISSAKADLSVVRNNPLVGVLQAEGALKFAPKGTYALMKGDPANDVAQMIAKSYEKVLADKKGDVNIVFDQFIRNWDPKTALQNAENVLSAQNDNVAAFVTSNDGMATAVAQAVKGRNLQGKVYISGLDADPANLRLIAAGVQTMSVWTDLSEQGKMAVQGAYELAQGKPFSFPTEQIDSGAGPVPAFLVKVTAVDKDNLCQFVTKDAPAGWVKVEEVFPDKPDACK